MHWQRVVGVALAAALCVTTGETASAAAREAADPDLAFIDEMIVHHQGAVDDARALEPKARRPEVRRLLADVIRTQQAEIDQLRGWRRAWFPDAPAPSGHQAHHGAGTAASGADAATDPDLAFIEMMIPHHREAVAMSRKILETTTRPELARLAREVIGAQEKEIELMQRWQREWRPAGKAPTR